MRALWAAVVLQARDDLDSEPYNSVIWIQAYNFFTATGDWAVSRQHIADCLELHPDDLKRFGRAACASRAERDGGRKSAPAAISKPVVACTERPMGDARTERPLGDDTAAATVLTRTPVVYHPAPERRDRAWWINRFLNKQRVA